MIWEKQEYKELGRNWIKKLKDDQVEAKTDLCIIVSEIAPQKN